MRTYHPLLLLLGLTTTVAVCAPLPVHAQAKIYQEVSGSDSFILDAEALKVLESLGLSFASIENTAVPASGYPYAWKTIPVSSNPASFSYDDETGAIAILSRTIHLDGSLFFNVDTTRLALAPQLELRDLRIPLGAGPNVSFLVTDTVANARLSVLDVVAPNRPPSIDLDSKSLEFEGLEFRISHEFSDFLVAAGATEHTAGLKFATVRAERGFVQVGATEVPEPSSVMAILTAASAALAVSKRYRAA